MAPEVVVAGVVAAETALIFYIRRTVAVKVALMATAVICVFNCISLLRCEYYVT